MERFNIGDGQDHRLEKSGGAVFDCQRPGTSRSLFSFYVPDGGAPAPCCGLGYAPYAPPYLSKA